MSQVATGLAARIFSCGSVSFSGAGGGGGGGGGVGTSGQQ